ncbi:type I-E CRISPR-associated protein Cse1/CasA [Actinomadura kijaniata]|uniref:type I-E CRISPR-associated protein Cse1/CasA n=1 Tax=Actinomadura kijaniata TaxID=46161 RepID=UPI003F199F30
MQSEQALPAFHLTERPWLPVLRIDGTEDVLSLREVFAQAEDVRRLVGDVPTQEFALLRLLLAVLHDAVDGPEDADHWNTLWNDGLPVPDITAYLDRHRDRLDLLHPTAPFLQTAGLRTAKDEVFSLDRIVADVPNGEPFFTMRATGADRVGFAEAARWVVHAHAFDTSGIKTGVHGDGRVKNGKVYPLGVGWAGSLGGVFAEADTLRETLLLNLVAFDTPGFRVDTERDRPAWRQEPTGPGQREDHELTQRPYGPRDLYTWQSRRVRLHADADGVHGVVLGYGDPLPPANKHDREPMTTWRRSPAQERKLGRSPIYLPREHDVTRSAWRGLAALITGEVEGGEQRQEAAAEVRPRVLDWVARLTVEGDLDPDRLIRSRLVGAVYGTQQSVIDEIVDDAVAMPLVLLRERDAAMGRSAVDAVADADRAARLLGDLAANIATTSGADPDPPRSAAKTLAYAALDDPFRRWLASLRPGDDPHHRRREWQRDSRALIGGLGDDLLRQAPETAWEGRTITTRQGKELWLNAARADLLFRARLRRELPGPADQNDEPPADQPANRPGEPPADIAAVEEPA